MSGVDWSKAPEGATHHYAGDNEPWRKIEGCFLYAWLGARWIRQAGCPPDPKYYTERPAPAWSGEGLPPVGTVCEFTGHTHCREDPTDKDLHAGARVHIIAHFKDGDLDLAAFTFNPNNPDRGTACVSQGAFGCFRPLRTPEQIAAEDREKAIKDMFHVMQGMGDDLDCARRLYDAGYRKPEIK